MNKVVLAFFAHVGTLEIPPKIIYILKIEFFHLFYNSLEILEQLLFFGKMHFSTKKNNFPKNMDFGAFFGNIHIIKALNFQIKGA